MAKAWKSKGTAMMYPGKNDPPSQHPEKPYAPNQTCAHFSYVYASILDFLSRFLRFCCFFLSFFFLVFFFFKVQSPI